MGRLGILGGSFDPPHIGHFICARAAAEFLGLEKVIVIPAAIQPLKSYGPAAPDEARWEMLNAIAGCDQLFEFSRIELDREGPSYTVDTLELLRQTYPTDEWEIFLLMGMDALMDIHAWRRPDRLFELAFAAVMSRNGAPPPDMPDAWRRRTIFVPTPKIEISSTEIRHRLARSLPVDLMVTRPVSEIIRRLGLYRG